MSRVYKAALRPLAYFIVLAAVGLGVWARFIGLGTWPLATDEYYIYQSVANWLENGLPQYAIGGYYTRGIIYQMLALPLLASGIDVELSIRIIPALTSLLTLAAVFKLAQLTGHSKAAWIGICILALSVWEVEIARYGRMYAPFQALFMWHLYFACRYLKHSGQESWWWVLGLAALGPFVWEGGVFLPIFNLLLVLLFAEKISARRLFESLLVLVIGVMFLQADFRMLDDSGPEITAFEGGLPLAGVLDLEFGRLMILDLEGLALYAFRRVGHNGGLFMLATSSSPFPYQAHAAKVDSYTIRTLGVGQSTIDERLDLCRRAARRCSANQ